MDLFKILEDGVEAIKEVPGTVKELYRKIGKFFFPPLPLSKIQKKMDQGNHAFQQIRESMYKSLFKNKEDFKTEVTKVIAHYQHVIDSIAYQINYFDMKKTDLDNKVKFILMKAHTNLCQIYSWEGPSRDLGLANNHCHTALEIQSESSALFYPELNLANMRVLELNGTPLSAIKAAIDLTIFLKNLKNDNKIDDKHYYHNMATICTQTMRLSDKLAPHEKKIQYVQEHFEFCSKHQNNYDNDTQVPHSKRLTKIKKLNNQLNQKIKEASQLIKYNNEQLSLSMFAHWNTTNVTGPGQIPRLIG